MILVFITLTKTHILSILISLVAFMFMKDFYLKHESRIGEDVENFEFKISSSSLEAQFIGLLIYVTIFFLIVWVNK